MVAIGNSSNMNTWYEGKSLALGGAKILSYIHKSLLPFFSAITALSLASEHYSHSLSVLGKTHVQALVGPGFWRRVFGQETRQIGTQRQKNTNEMSG